MKSKATAQRIALETLELLNVIFRDDSTAILSSAIPHKGCVGDANAAFVALASRIVQLAAE